MGLTESQWVSCPLPLFVRGVGKLWPSTGLGYPKTLWIRPWSESQRGFKYVFFQIEKFRPDCCEQAKEELKTVFESLTQDERNAILDPKGAGKLPQKEATEINANLNSLDLTNCNNAPPQDAKKISKAKSENAENVPVRNLSPLLFMFKANIFAAIG